MDLTKFLKEADQQEPELKIGDKVYKINHHIRAYLAYLDWLTKNQQPTVNEIIKQVLTIGINEAAYNEIMNLKNITSEVLIRAISYILSEWQQQPFEDVLKTFNIFDKNEKPNT